MSNHDENDLSFSSPTSIPADLAPPRNEDTLLDLYDPVSANFVYEGFRRLGCSIYSVTSLQSVLDKAFPDVTDYDNGRPFFIFQRNHKAPKEKNYGIGSYRKNPNFHLGKGKPSHFTYGQVLRAMNTELPQEEQDAFCKRIHAQRAHLERPFAVFDEEEMDGVQPFADVLRDICRSAPSRRKSKIRRILELQHCMDNLDPDTEPGRIRMRLMH